MFTEHVLVRLAKSIPLSQSKEMAKMYQKIMKKQRALRQLQESSNVNGSDSEQEEVEEEEDEFTDLPFEDRNKKFGSDDDENDSNGEKPFSPGDVHSPLSPSEGRMYDAGVEVTKRVHSTAIFRKSDSKKTKMLSRNSMGKRTKSTSKSLNRKSISFGKENRGRLSQQHGSRNESPTSSSGIDGVTSTSMDHPLNIETDEIQNALASSHKLQVENSSDMALDSKVLPPIKGAVSENDFIKSTSDINHSSAASSSSPNTVVRLLGDIGDMETINDAKNKNPDPPKLIDVENSSSSAKMISKVSEEGRRGASRKVIPVQENSEHNDDKKPDKESQNEHHIKKQGLSSRNRKCCDQSFFLISNTVLMFGINLLLLCIHYTVVNFVRFYPNTSMLGIGFLRDATINVPLWTQELAIGDEAFFNKSVVIDKLTKEIDAIDQLLALSLYGGQFVYDDIIVSAEAGIIELNDEVHAMMVGPLAEYPPGSNSTKYEPWRKQGMFNTHGSRVIRGSHIYIHYNVDVCIQIMYIQNVHI